MKEAGIVGPIQEVAPVGGSERDERCMSLQEIMDSGVVSLAILRAQQQGRIDTREVQARVATYDSAVISRGCTGETSGSIREDIRVVLCPGAAAEQCGQCILRLVEDGDKLQEALARLKS